MEMPVGDDEEAERETRIDAVCSRGCLGLLSIRTCLAIEEIVASFLSKQLRCRVESHDFYFIFALKKTWQETRQRGALGM